MERNVIESKKVCYACGSSETLVDKRYGTKQWMNNLDEQGNIIHVICSRCYDIFREKNKRKVQKKMNYYNHRDEKIQKVNTYYYNNRDKIRERRKEYDGRPEVKKAQAVGQSRRRWKTRIELINVLGGYCVKCNIADFRVLQIDHKRGQGAAEVKTLFGSKGWMGMYRYYRDNPEQAKKYLQILCFNCNVVKKYENGEIRHYFDAF